MTQRPFFCFLLIWGMFLFGMNPAQAGVFNAQTFTLKNGMQVVLVPNHRVPIVNHMVWYKVGSADEPMGKSGIAHFFEHLMFKATDKLEAGEFSRIIARNGGRENAFTSYDYTAYYQTVAKDRLPLMMEMEANRMTHLTLTPEVIEPERQVILEERRQRTDNDPAAQLREQLNATLFMNHPYRIPIIGWAHEIETLSLADLQTFYRAWYAPNNAILVVGGDITMAELKPLAEKYYGTIPRGPDIERVRPQEPPAHSDRLLIREDERVRQPSWQRLYLAPSYKRAFAGSDAMTPYALQVLEEIMSNGANGRLYQSLVVDQKVALGAGLYYSPMDFDLSQLGLWATPAPGVSMDAIETAYMAEIQTLLEKGVSFDEVEKTKKKLQTEAIYARDRITTGTRVLGQALAIGMTVDQVENWPHEINKVTVEDVNRAAKLVFDGQRSVSAHLLPKSKEMK